ncbi:MAG TPA: hypothetical protein PLA85_12405 [Micropepsaceae bacterium]|nr:hypothetical protein [Micropepsaceae bacterium]HRK72384.1 hypothetical protein [Micropepsaceae bacterium]
MDKLLNGKVILWGIIGAAMWVGWPHLVAAVPAVGDVGMMFNGMGAGGLIGVVMGLLYGLTSKPDVVGGIGGGAVAGALAGLLGGVANAGIVGGMDAVTGMDWMALLKMGVASTAAGGAVGGLVGKLLGGSSS